MSDQIQSFHQYLQAEKRYSPNTCLAYLNDVNQCKHFLKTTYEFSDWTTVNHSMLRSWLVFLTQNNLSPRSINRKISTIKSFYNFLKRRFDLQRNPTVKLVALRKKKRLPSTIDEKTVQRLLDYLCGKDDFGSLRDQMIIELLYQTGMRRAELISLKHQDVDFMKGQIKVIGKGNKERYVPIGRKLLALIRQYERIKRECRFTHFSPQMIVTDKGKPVYPKFIYNRVTHLISLVSTIEKRNPHVLRHSFATHLSNHGAELNAIKELMGHASLAATQIYTHNTIDKLKKAYKKAHPKS